jgi:hypothetical protein
MPKSMATAAVDRLMHHAHLIICITARNVQAQRDLPALQRTPRQPSQRGLRHDQPGKGKPALFLATHQHPLAAYRHTLWPPTSTHLTAYQHEQRPPHSTFKTA